MSLRDTVRRIFNPAEMLAEDLQSIKDNNNATYTHTTKENTMTYDYEECNCEDWDCECEEEEVDDTPDSLYQAMVGFQEAAPVGSGITYTKKIMPNGNSTVTIANDMGDVLTASTEDPSNYARIAQGVEDGLSYDQIVSVIAQAKAELKAVVITELSERVSVDNYGHTLFDGVEVHSSVATAIATYHDNNKDCTGLVRFMERLNDNPSSTSVRELYDWMELNGVHVNSDGMIIGYRGVGAEWLSSHGGVHPFSVDGVVKAPGKIPNHVGTTVAMARNQVDDNTSNGCSAGLHIGTLDFARGWASGHMLVVLVDPADVVSVPRDSFEKMRCCEYFIHSEYKEEVNLEAQGPRDEVMENFIESLVESAPDEWLKALATRLGSNR